RRPSKSWVTFLELLFGGCPVERAGRRWFLMVSRPPNGFDLPKSPCDAILREIASRVPPQQFETWFRNLPMVLEGPGRIVITAANNFSRIWIERKFREVIASSARQVLGSTPRIEILVAR